MFRPMCSPKLLETRRERLHIASDGIGEVIVLLSQSPLHCLPMSNPLLLCNSHGCDVSCSQLSSKYPPSPERPFKITALPSARSAAEGVLIYSFVLLHLGHPNSVELSTVISRVWAWGCLDNYKSAGSISTWDVM